MRAPTKAQVVRFIQNLPHTADIVTREMERQARITIEMVSRVREGMQFVEALRQGRIKISIEPPEREDERERRGR